MFYLTSKFRGNISKRGTTMPISQAILQGKLIKYRKYNHYADKIW